jgi:uncharacterized protein YjbI with pentapeptide repeats
LNIIKVILAAFPSIVFGIFTIVFTLQQNHVANENRKQDQQQAEEHNIRTTFENYIDHISALLLDNKFNRSNSEYLLHLRVKTLTVLRHVDVPRKRDIILFLYESRLIRSDMPDNERLNLNSADLHDVQFLGSSGTPFQLDYLYLPGIYAPNIVFSWCALENAVFDNASISNAKIINSTIANSSFRRIYAPDLTIGDAMLHQTNFTEAVPVRTYFISVTDWNEAIDLTNADLLGSYNRYESSVDFNYFDHRSLILRNARLPGGSFRSIDSSNLIVDGGAEEGVYHSSYLLHFLICFSSSVDQMTVKKYGRQKVFHHR